MTGRRFLFAALAALTLAAPAMAQPAEEPMAASPQATGDAPPSASVEAPVQVDVAPLVAPDFFSAGARDTGLTAQLWRGASADTLRRVLPILAAKPLSPAARALARRVLATGAAGPKDAGADADLAGARLNALLAQGDIADTAAILSRTSGLEKSSALSQAAAETALLSGDDDRACAVAGGLGVDRGGVYWLRLRAYCEAKGGQVDAARLTFDLAQGQARDAVYGRLMSAKLAGGGAPVPAARNGLDYALSRSLNLDLAQADPAQALAAISTPQPPANAVWDVPGASGPVQSAVAALAAGNLQTAQEIRKGLAADPAAGIDVVSLALLDAMLGVQAGKPDGAVLDVLVDRGMQTDPKTRARPQTAALILAAAGAPLSAAARGPLAGFTVGEAKTMPARGLALNLAARDKLVGETALLALWISADGGLSGPALGDRIAIIQALRTVGLEDDARAFAVEGLLALR